MGNSLRWELFRSVALFATLAGAGPGCVVDEPGGPNETARDAAVARAANDDLYRAFQINCSSPSCGYQVATLNESTWCPEYGLFAGTCRMWGFDLADAGLTAEDEAATLQAISASGLSGGAGGVLLRGEIVVSEYPYSQSGLRSDFVANEVWWGGTGALVTNATGAFVRVTDKGNPCTRDPCFSLREAVVNGHTRHHLSGLDFEPSGADAEQIAEAMDAAATDDGVIVVGALVAAETGRRDGLERTVEEYFVRIPQD